MFLTVPLTALSGSLLQVEPVGWAQGRLLKSPRHWGPGAVPRSAESATFPLLPFLPPATDNVTSSLCLPVSQQMKVAPIALN